ncbi:MAG: Ig-like domain repeat protein [Xanthomonadales bacterium]|nr:Ig-like domain repeat protein [Xanthomonadales bacterium]
MHALSSLSSRRRGASRVPFLLLALLLGWVGPVLGSSSSAAMSAGGAHTCALAGSGTVKCWGSGGQGQIGRWGASLRPVAVSGISTAASLAAGYAHQCVLLGDTTVRCFGANDKGQLGDGNTSYGSATPLTVQGLGNVVALAAGREHSCALLGNGLVQCWGGNGRGQLGDGTGTDSAVPVTVSGVTVASAISVGSDHTCALVGIGGVRCWGANDEGQLGDGTRVDRNTAVTLVVPNDAVAIAAGGLHTCAVRSDGSLSCWGNGEGGALGNGSWDDALAPVAVPGLSGVARVVAGGNQTCVGLADGSVQCFGGNEVGQLGNGSTAPSNVPFPVGGLSDVQALTTDGGHVCALRSNNALWCWGSNIHGELGNGFAHSVPHPVPVTQPNASPPPDGGEAHACSVGLGLVWCWGDNFYGQLGDGTQTARPTAALVSGISTATQVVSGKSHACALLADQTVRCWGRGDSGELGNGLHSHSNLPVVVSGLGQVTELAAGLHHTCARRSDGSLRCWGANWYGQAGNGNSGVAESTPVAVSGISTALQVVAGEHHTCAVLANGSLRCFGRNGDGQLGDGSVIDRSTPVAVSGLTVPTAGVVLAVGSEHTCAIAVGGGVRCWGWDGYGQLGQGAAVGSSPLPLVVSDVPAATALAAGQRHTCAARSDGRVACWGENANGQLGDDTQSSSNFPRTVVGIGQVTMLSAGLKHSCGGLDIGSTLCWGMNSAGQLGGEHGRFETTPQAVFGTPFATHHSIGGVLTGLAPGNSVILRNNGGDDLLLAADGAFAFSIPVADGNPYAVIVFAPPTFPNQNCVVSNGSGTVAGLDIGNIGVTCTTLTYSVGGTLSGLAAGTSVVLQNNGGDDRSLGANGSFVFATALVDGSSYSVSVRTQPANQACTVGSGNGTLNGSNVADVSVTCVAGTPTHTVTPSAGAHGSIAPGTPQSVAANAVATFTLSPDAGYGVSVGGTCGGNLSGNQYTTAQVTADCTVAATFPALTTTTLDVPAPVRVGQSTAFAARVTATGGAPAAGALRIDASSGETCTDNTATIDGSNAVFACDLSFASLGPRSLSASYLGASGYQASSSAGQSVTVSRFADLAVAGGDGGISIVHGGQHVSYTMTVQNTGPDPAPGTALLAELNATLSGIAWTCSVPAGSSAVCPPLNVPASATLVGATVDLPAGSSLQFAWQGDLPAVLDPTLDLQWSAAPATAAPHHVHDPAYTNNAAYDHNLNDGIFASGFE